LSGDYIANIEKNGQIRTQILSMATSKVLWERRIAIMSTFAYIRNKEFQYSLDLAKILINDSHDLMHKAVGWMLREVGNRDEKVLCDFLDENIKQMPRTMVRYAIEKLEESKRKYYLNLK
jgi:3-methyladenine DNA glycosylase AlkD